jgi:4-hydroxy-tetrahydrodipicolinate synthase
MTKDDEMQCSGLWPPVATPFGPDGSVDRPAFLHHCRTLLEEGADGLAKLGTTSEANSLTLHERREAIDTLLGGGIDPSRVLPGTGACAVGDAVELSRHATRGGCAGVLLLPPFFYKGVPDDGLFDYVSRVIDGVDDGSLRIYLYHIPQMAGAGWSLDLIDRLRSEFTEIVVGLKDSSGDWQNTRSILERFPGLAVFPASESMMSDAIPLGAAGCISASANVNSRGIAALIGALRSGGDATRLQERASEIRASVSSFPLVPAVKAVLARRYGEPGWLRVRPPLRPLDEAGVDALMASPGMGALAA